VGITIGILYCSTYDTVRDYKAIRKAIGYMPGRFSLYQDMSVEENLAFFATVFNTTIEANYHLIKDIYRQIEPFKNRKAGALSGGMKQKLALSCALIHKPKVLFLDEPTTGLDPRSRLGMWEVIRGLVREGTTLLLTTQYLEEADELADTIAVVDQGRIIARGTADQLKSQVGGERIEVVVRDSSRIDDTVFLLQRDSAGPAEVDAHTRRITVPSSGGATHLMEVVRRLDEQQIAIDDIGLRRPTLDDVFLSLTGHAAQGAGDDEAVEAAAGPRSNT